MPAINGEGNTPLLALRITFVPVGIFVLYGKFNVLLDFNPTHVWVTFAVTVGAEVNPIPALITDTDCIYSFSILGYNLNWGPWPPVSTLSSTATKLASPYMTLS